MITIFFVFKQIYVQFETCATLYYLCLVIIYPTYM